MAIKGKKIMIVDDSITIRKSAQVFLSSLECDLIQVDDGFEALATLAVTSPDMIFLDVMMPNLDGYSTCALIKQNIDYRDIPIVMLTSKDTLLDLAKGNMMGCNEYLVKPFNKASLIEIVQKYLS